MVHVSAVVSTLMLSAICITAHQPQPSWATPWNDLRVTFSLPYNPASGYFRLPRTFANAVNERWNQPPEEAWNRAYTIMCRETDPSVCVLFHRMSGNIVGIQLSYLVSDAASPYDYRLHPTFVRNRRFNHDVFTITTYIVKPTRAVRSTIRTGEGIWMQTGPQGAPYFEIPRREAALQGTRFGFESCVPGMGDHYYYNVARQLPCELYEPVFGLYKNQEMIGFGIKAWGNATQLGSRQWYEPVPSFALRPTLPNAPECVFDWSERYGLISLHVYFVDQPWTIACP